MAWVTAEATIDDGKVWPAADNSSFSLLSLFHLAEVNGGRTMMNATQKRLDKSRSSENLLSFPFYPCFTTPPKAGAAFINLTLLPHLLCFYITYRPTN